MCNSLDTPIVINKQFFITTSPTHLNVWDIDLLAWYNILFEYRNL